MPNPLAEAEKIGAGRTYQNPNDPALVGGMYSDEVEKLSPEQRSVMAVNPMAPAKTPFVVRGGI
jgi:hypothetical protein